MDDQLQILTDLLIEAKAHLELDKEADIIGSEVWVLINQIDVVLDSAVPVWSNSVSTKTT